MNLQVSTQLYDWKTNCLDWIDRPLLNPNRAFQSSINFVSNLVLLVSKQVTSGRNYPTYARTIEFKRDYRNSDILNCSYFVYHKSGSAVGA